VPNLDLKINGDCLSAVTALSNTERAIGGVQKAAGSGVAVAVSVAGARSAQKDLAGVATAMNSTTAAAAGLRSGGAIAGGLGAGAVAARGLTSSLGSTTRALGAVRQGSGGVTAVGTSAAAATRSISGMAGAIGGLGRTASRVSGGPGILPGGGVASIAGATRAVNAHRVALASQQLQMARGLPVMAMANAGTAAMAANANAASTAATRLQSRDPLNGRFIDRNPGYLGTIRQGWREGVAQARAGTGGPPPVIPPLGGGGGGGRGDADPERAGATAAKAGAEIGKGIGTMLMAGLAVGVATNAAYTKHAMTAINTTISETPGLAEKATDAADELGKGILDITTGADLDQFAASFERLGTANRALGQVQAQIGMDTIGTKLATEAEMADATTRAYARMAPAMDAAIRGSNSLGVAMMDGISNPQVVNGVRAVSEVLAKPEIKKGLADITTGATGASLVFAKVMGDASAFASNTLNTVVGGQNVTDMSSALFGGSMVAALSKGGMGQKLGFGALGASAIAGSQSLMARGKDELVTPSIVNMLLASTLAKSIPGKIALGMAGQYGTEGLTNALPPGAADVAPWGLAGVLAGAKIGMMRGGPRGAIIGGAGAAAGIGGGAALAGNAPMFMPPSATEVQAGRSTTLKDVMDNRGPTGPSLDGADKGLAGGKPVTSAAPSISEWIFGKSAAPAGPVQPGPQQPDEPKGNTLQERQKATRDRVNEERRERGQRPAGSGTGPVPGAGPPPVPPPAPPPVSAQPVAMASSATQQLSQNAQQATQSVQQMGQAMPVAAAQTQALPNAFAASTKTTASLQAASQRNMTQAASTISTAASDVGASIPPAISTGIVKQTPKVCDSAADMGNSMVNCTARALLSASPSKKFIALGESTGDGAKIGVDNSAGGAIDATGNMVSGMLGQVGALGSGVEAASDGAVPIAESGGLMVGYVWARSVATGVDSVLKSADFAQATMPSINSTLAKSTLGKLGLLGPAGSGASISKTANGGMISMPPPVINATFQVTVDGAGPMQVISQRVVDTSMGALVDSIGRQRG
jgi:hypothetical protein